MKVYEYIKKCDVGSVDELSIEQMLLYYEKYSDIVSNKISCANYKLYSKRKGFPKRIAKSVLSDSLKIEPHYFVCSYIDGESADANKVKSTNGSYMFETIGRKEVVDL